MSWETDRTADVVVLTAIRLELDAALAVEAGAVPGTSWEVVDGPSGLPVAFRPFSQAMRKTLALEMEGAAIAELAHRQRQYALDAVVMKGVMETVGRA